MDLLLVFSVTFFIGILVSDLAERTVLSTAAIFLAAGGISTSLGWIHITPQSTMVTTLADLALVSVLFTDAMKVGVMDLAKAWRLPGRALLLGLPLTLILSALLVWWLLDFSWLEALLIGAVLSPTDPVFASALVGNERVPERLRYLLNVESGLNDGLALPFVVILLSLVGGSNPDIQNIVWDLLLGVTIGVIIPWFCIRLIRTRFFGAAPVFRPLFAFSLILLVYAVTSATRSNQFLAAFSAGVTVATLSEEAKELFAPFGTYLTELLKLAALLVFGALISWRFLADVSWREVLCAFLILFLARPIALTISLAKSDLGYAERIAAAWFGPKGFASVVYGLLVLKSGYPHSIATFHFLALVIAMSIVIHSSTDVPIGNWLAKRTDHGSESIH